MRFSPMAVQRVICVLGAASLTIGMALGLSITTGHAQTIPPDTRSRLSGDYSRYQVPGQCRWAAMRELVGVWRAVNPRDTLSYAQAVLDTIPLTSRVAAANCLDSIMTTPLRLEQQFAAAEVALVANRDGMATRIIVDSVLPIVSRDARGWYWWGYQFSRLFSGRLIRPHPTVLDTFTQTLDPKRQWGTWKAAQFYRRDHARGLGRFDAANNIDREIRTALDWQFRKPNSTVSRNASFEIRDAFGSSYDDLTMMRSDEVVKGATPKAILDSMRNAFVQQRLNPDAPFSGIAAFFSRSYMFKDSTLRLGVPGKAPHILADAWVHRPDTVARPRAGRVTLVFLDVQEMIEKQLHGWREFPSIWGPIGVVRRLAERYASAGLEVVWVASTRGYFRESSVLNFEEEQNEVSKFLFDYLRAPGMLAFIRADTVRRDDGRLMRQDSPLLAPVRAFQSHTGIGDVFLVDRQGNVIVTMSSYRIDQNTETIFARLIERALGNGE